jgi:hypothetical protein
MYRVALDYRGRQLVLAIEGDDLVLSLNGVERKRRSRGDGSCVYVWTNVELEWEEHHYIEARWWPAHGRVRVTVNGSELLDAAV